MLADSQARSRLGKVRIQALAAYGVVLGRAGAFSQHALQLTRADHSSFVDDQHIARSPPIAIARPAKFQAGDRARRNARPAF